MSVWQVKPYKFNVVGDDMLLSPWREITGLGERINNHWQIAALPNYAVQQVAFVDMGMHTPAAHAKDDDRLTLAENGKFVLNLRGVEHIDADLNKNVDLEVVSKTGFTTDGSFNSVTVNVGNHNIYYTGATRDSSLFTGFGWDQVRLIDQPLVWGTQYWAIVRREDGEVDAYSLYSGYRVRMEGGGATWGNASGRLNYGEVDEIYLASRNRPDGDVYLPGTNKPDTGDRGSFDNIDLSDATVTNYTDRFIAASFKSINYATQNVHKGTAIVESFNGDTTGGVQSSSRDHISTNGVHDLIVTQQSAALDGHLRLYVRDNNSGLYNRFNEVFLGSSGNDGNANTYSTTSLNAYATNQATGEGVTPVLGTAMYGFDGNDVLSGGTDADYLFGGTSSYSIIEGVQLGNILTGGTGADFFGTGNISVGEDGDVIMTTNFNSRLAGTAPLSTDAAGRLSRLDVSDSADLATRVATDRITDWTYGLDSLRVLPNGTAIIEGLGTANGAGGAYVADPIGSDAETINLSSKVNNEGKIVVRGLGGQDNLIGSTGDDWLYGNAARNGYDISQGGNDRIYIDQFDGAQSKHYVNGFTTAAVAGAANHDLVMLNKRVVDAFYAAGASRADLTKDVNGEYVRSQSYSSNVNFLHDSFYNPAIAAPNSTHNSSDGQNLFSGSPSGSDGTTSIIGLGMAVAGRALMAIPFVGPIIGAALIATGTLLNGVVPSFPSTTPHNNATFDGDVDAYLNVLTDTSTNGGNGVLLRPNTTVGNDDLGVSFLSFFQDNNAGDGYIPLVEFTAHPNQPIYGYFALHSDDETFVYLVASRDNLIENGEAILMAQLNGNLKAVDFGIYNGESDIYNYGTSPEVVLRDPTITSVRDSAATPDEGITDGLIASATNPIRISGNVSGGLSANSYFRLYDGANLIYEGPNASYGLVTLSTLGSAFTFTDARPLGTTVKKTDTADITLDNNFVLTDGRVNYTVELVDGQTGIPTRDTSIVITVAGGNAIIDGDTGSDSLNITGTSNYLNGASDPKIIGIESIVINTKDTNGDGQVTSADAPVTLNLSNQSDGFSIYGTPQIDFITGSSGDDVILGMGGQDLIDLSTGGTDRVTVAYDDARMGSNDGYDLVTGMSGGSDNIYIVPAGLADTDDDGQFDDAVSGWVDRDGDSTRLMYETAVIGANKTVSSATELLVVSNATVSTAGGLTANIATALGSAFNLASLDGNIPSATTGGGSGSTSIFAVQSDQANKWWVGRYVDAGNDDITGSSEIEVLGLFGTDNILTSFWQGVVQSPQPLTLTLPSDTGPVEAAGLRFYTQNLNADVTGLTGTQYLVYSLDGGANWTFNALGVTSFNLTDNTSFNAGQIIVRTYDGSGYAAPITGSLIAAASLPQGNYSVVSTSNIRDITTDNTVPSAPAAPDLDATDDVGVGTSTDNITTQTTALTFNGTVDANVTVELYDDTTLVGSTTSDGAGAYSVSIDLAPGSHSIKAKAGDLAGNLSVASPALSVLVSYTDISSGASLGSVAQANVQINNTNFASPESLGSSTKVHVLSSLVSSSVTASYYSVDASGAALNWSSPMVYQPVLSSLVGFIEVQDAYFGDEASPNIAVSVINKVVNPGIFQGAHLFAALDDGATFGNNPRIWYWNDSDNNGSASVGEITEIATLVGNAAPSGVFVPIIV